MMTVKDPPQTAGVYLMKDAAGKILYIGKAANLKRRVLGYYGRPQESRLEALLRQVAKIDYKKTDTALEALILESALIKIHQPPYNIREKDDKSFLWVKITKEKWPRVLLIRKKGDFGPFTSAGQVRQALKIIRRIFPYNLHLISERNSDRERSPRFKRPCLDYELGLCPGACLESSSTITDDCERLASAKSNIKMLRLFFRGKKRQILRQLEREMAAAAKKLYFEAAEKIKRQIFALQHIQDIALIGDNQSMDLRCRYVMRVEGYDVSNISGTSAAGAMVVFENGEPAKDQYRKFRIRNFTEPNDIGMLKEMLRRRLNHQEWPLPDLILVDGGRGQVNAASAVLKESGLKIPVVGIAKGPRRRKNEFINLGVFARPMVLRRPKIEKILIRVRDEAHRFALSYHRRIRHKFSTARPLASVRGVLYLK